MITEKVFNISAYFNRICYIFVLFGATKLGAEQYKKSWWPSFQSSRCRNDSHYPRTNSEQLYDEIWASSRTFCDLWKEHNSCLILPKPLNDICESLTATSKVCLQETNKRNLWRALVKAKWGSNGKGEISCSLLEWFQGKTNRYNRKIQSSKTRKGKTWRGKVLVE